MPDTIRYRCAGCGNLTRFDVVATRRVREFQHYTVGGDCEIEESDLLEQTIETVTCRWCGATGERIEVVPVEVVSPEATSNAEATSAKGAS